jgi:hypothetical protein
MIRIPEMWPGKTITLKEFTKLYPIIPKGEKIKVNDPWKHRDTGMRCATCMFFIWKEVEGKPKHLGRCRRHAPIMGGYPPVFGTDWCGDHKIDETKV